jgi:hypothetical protein
MDTYCIKRWEKSLDTRVVTPQVLQRSRQRWTFDFSRAALFSSFQEAVEFLRRITPKCHDERYWYAPSSELEEGGHDVDPLPRPAV